MAEQEITVPMDDTGMLSSIMSDEPAKETTQEQPAETEGQPRDEQGRFAPKEATTADAAPTQQQPAEQKAPELQPTEGKDDGGQVPSWRLREVREAREAAERKAEEASRQSYDLQRQLQDLQRQLSDFRKPKQEPVDFFTDPNAAIKQSLDPIEDRFQTLASQLTLRASRAENVAVHGKDQVAEMEKAIDAAMRSNHPDMPLLAQRMRQSDDPVGDAMQWYQRDKLLKETGGDLTSYRNKTLDEALKDPAFLAKALEAANAQARGAQTNGSRPNVQIPPSLSKVTGSGASNTAAEDNDTSDAGLFRHATQGLRR